MNALHGMERYQKEMIQVSALKNNIKVQHLYNINCLEFLKMPKKEEGFLTFFIKYFKLNRLLHILSI